MRTTTARVGAAFMVAAASVAVGQTTANAEPAAHQVRYTLTSTAPTELNVYYLYAQPADKAAYNANANAYLKNLQMSLEPGVPWVFETTLEDPQWAILTVSGATHAMTGAPNPHCEIAIDGQVAVQQDGESGVQCQLSRW